MKTKNIDTLISDLTKLTATSFKEQAMTQNKLLLKKCESISELIHGKRSQNVLNYMNLPIENELKSIKISLQFVILDQIAKRNYSGDTIDKCFADFCFAHDLDYGEIGMGDPEWDGSEPAGKATANIVLVLLEKLKKKLREDLSDEKRERYMKILSGVKARYNGAKQEYKKAEVLLAEFDTEKKYKHEWV